MVYFTSDTHGQFGQIAEFCRENKTSTEDILIILGDAGINYYVDQRKRIEKLKKSISKLPITLLCIHGNHEARPDTIDGYDLVEFCGGDVYKQELYPNILFAKDGEIFSLDGKKCIAIGGAYSVDKFYRLDSGYSWFSDEQPSDRIKSDVEDKLIELDWKVDYVLSHTCPYKYIPREWFLSCIDQSTVDNSTELWLNEIEAKLNYSKWLCGHFHGEKVIDRIKFVFHNIKELK